MKRKKLLIMKTQILKIKITDDGADIISKRSRGTPRIANKLLRRIRDYAEVKYDGIINKKVAEDVLKILEIDSLGLDSMDRRILETIIHKYNGGPVGINTIAVSIGEEPDTIEEVEDINAKYFYWTGRNPDAREGVMSFLQKRDPKWTMKVSTDMPHFSKKK